MAPYYQQRSTETFNGKDAHPQTRNLEQLAYEAFCDVSFYLRPGHLKQVAAILDDPEASENDHFVARAFIENSIVSAVGELPTCQDTGTALITGYKGAHVWSDFNEKKPSLKAYTERLKNETSAILSTLTMFEEKNTGNNLPAQIDIAATSGNEYPAFIAEPGDPPINPSLPKKQNRFSPKSNSPNSFTELFNIGTAACLPITSHS